LFFLLGNTEWSWASPSFNNYAPHHCGIDGKTHTGQNRSKPASSSSSFSFKDLKSTSSLVQKKMKHAKIGETMKPCLLTPALTQMQKSCT
jgi:hypothetical protein